MDTATKEFYIQHNIGTAKYVVSFHNGESFYKDGSEFFDICIFKNKKKMEKFVQNLKQMGYIERV